LQRQQPTKTAHFRFNGAAITVIAEFRKTAPALFTIKALQWSRDHVIAELAALLSYSVFKDLRAPQRAPHHFTPSPKSRANPLLP